jgi:hypothetical protein
MTGGMTDPDTIAALGKQLGAQYVVSGSITSLGSQKLLVIAILKIDELRQIAGDVQTYVTIEEIQGKLPAMARNIAAAAVRVDHAETLTRLALPQVVLSGGADPRAADTLAQVLAVNLILTGKYAVYPRTASLEQIQEEHTRQLSGDFADEHLPEIGRGTNPELVLSVTARKLGSRNMFNAAIINMVTGVQETGETVAYETLSDGVPVMEELAAVLGGKKQSASDAASFYQALSAAYADTGGESYIITLEGSFTFNPVILGAGRRIILKSDGETRVIAHEGSNPLFIVPANAALILDNGVILDGNKKGGQGVAVTGGALIMKAGSTVRGSTAGGVYVGDGGSFTMSGGTISGNTADIKNDQGGAGGGVGINPGGSFTMSGGTISGNTGRWGGGIIVSGSFIMSRGTISENTGTYGGGVFVNNGGSFTMSEGTISGNTGKSDGGGVCINGDGSFAMSGGTISGNTGYYGGGVEVQGSFTMSGGTISGNTAVRKDDNGGGLYVGDGGDGGSSFTMTGGTISGNKARWGGGVFVEDDTVFVKNGGTIDGTNHAERGNVVFIGDNARVRNSAAGPKVNLDSRIDGIAGGWESGN